MRPVKTRRVDCLPGERSFRPEGGRAGGEPVRLTIDGFEALRLADREGLTHARAARQMEVSRPTFTRILAAARSAVAGALVEVRPLRIEGGCCRVGRQRGKNGLLS